MYNPPSLRLPRSQSGSVLVVSLVILVLLTLIVISIVRTSNVNMRVAGNMQLQKEAEAGAQQAIESVISTDFTTTAPATTTVQVDINHDGKADYNVTVPQPTCVSLQPIKTTDLDVSNSDDRACMTTGTMTNPGIVPTGGGSTAGNSLCSNTVWDVGATATPTSGGSTQVTTHQGISVRVAVGSSC